MSPAAVTHSTEHQEAFSSLSVLLVLPHVKMFAEHSTGEKCQVSVFCVFSFIVVQKKPGPVSDMVTLNQPI